MYCLIINVYYLHIYCIIYIFVIKNRKILP